MKVSREAKTRWNIHSAHLFANVNNVGSNGWYTGGTARRGEVHNVAVPAPRQDLGAVLASETAQRQNKTHLVYMNLKLKNLNHYGGF